MDIFEHLYDQTESTKVRFLGLASKDSRYDFGVVFTKQFFGKPLVICMQTGRSTLMCSEEAQSVEHIQKAFNIENEKEANELSEFFQHHLPSMPLDAQY